MNVLIFNYILNGKLDDMLVPTKKGATMHTTVIVKKQSSLCMEITYLLKPANGVKNETVRVHIKPLDNKKNHGGGFAFVKHLDHKWNNVKLPATAPLAIGSYNISVTFSSENFFIGGIQFCNNGM
jgi:hypothetical protein